MAFKKGQRKARDGLKVKAKGTRFVLEKVGERREIVSKITRLSLFKGNYYTGRIMP